MELNYYYDRTKLWRRIVFERNLEYLWVRGHAQNDQKSQKTSKIQKNAFFPKFELLYLTELWLKNLFRAVSHCCKHIYCTTKRLWKIDKKCAIYNTLKT